MYCKCIIFLASLLISIGGANAQNWLCVEDVSVSISKVSGSWRSILVGSEKWTVSENSGKFTVSSFSIESIKKQNKEYARANDLNFYCSTRGTVVCEGGMGSRFEFNKDTLKFVSFSRGIAYLIGAEKGDAPGPSMAIGVCSPF